MDELYEFYVAGRGRHSRCLMAAACTSDDDAMTVAQRLAAVRGGIEAWLDDRLVGRILLSDEPAGANGNA